MPLSSIQRDILAVTAGNRSPDSHLAGAGAIHIADSSARMSHDLDLFHDSLEAVGEAFAKDRSSLEAEGFELSVALSQPGFIRAMVERDGQSLLVDWAQDSAWRYLPPVQIEGVGFVLHPVDLAVNKVLALAGRDEPRDLLDALFLDRTVLPLGALVWAATGKDPGLNPEMLLELLSRKGKVRPEELRRLDLTAAQEPTAIHDDWQTALESARAFIRSRPPEEAGCLYRRPGSTRFFAPASGEDAEPHRPLPGGVLPRLSESAGDAFSDPEFRSEIEQFFERRIARPEA